jgi:hypothetical protein
MAHVLDYVRKCVGEFSEWPNYILEYLFCKDIDNNTSRLVLCAFFYGHDVDPGIVCRLIRLVNGYWDVHIKYYVHDP